MKTTRRTAYSLGAVLGLATLVVLNLPITRTWHSPGVMNTGHEEVECDDCHRSSKGVGRSGGGIDNPGERFSIQSSIEDIPDASVPDITIINGTSASCFQALCSHRPFQLQDGLHRPQSVQGSVK